ncbi:uncharacterized protein LOC111831043 [Capsella rubella]|uniref:uncharacterized protein LOC111831043 n=1 Tax=Capsella rubella TaxID=81985 RepID=UPI000CD57424|nr:uncharacterized protein LOC111831043 [Capsella rubella]
MAPTTKPNPTGSSVDGKAFNLSDLRDILLTSNENLQATLQSSLDTMTQAIDRLITAQTNRPATTVKRTAHLPIVEHRPRTEAYGRDLEQRPHDSRWESSFRVEIPEFHRGIRGDALLDWLFAVEEILDFKSVPDDRRVALVVTRFRGHAASWWQQTKATRSRSGKDPIRSWEKLKKKLKETFMPHNYDRTIYTKLQNLRQGSRTVDEYAEEFYLLLSRNEVYDSQVQLVSRFIGGLRLQLQNAMCQFDPDSVAEAHRRASSFEQQQRTPSWSTPGSRSRSSDQSPVPGGFSPRNAVDQPKMDNKPVVKEDDPGLRRSSRNALRCFACGEPGHRQTACPNYKRGWLFTEENLKDDDDVCDDLTSVEKETEEPLHHTSGDKGISLVLNRTCLTPQQREEHWLRTNIFRSSCTIRDRICTFIIDSGSSRNVVSASALQKLGIPSEPHPTPYSLTWFQDGVATKVSRRALVPFSIGPYYKDRFYFDVAHMDICHLILGRPWEFHRKIIHDGEANTYQFYWETHKILLLPSPEPSLSPPLPRASPTSTLAAPSPILCSHADFELAFREEGMALAMIPLYSANTSNPAVIPQAFESLLAEFADVFPSDLPLGLPPLRDIQHHIDLVPGASLPNRPHYRMSPSEHEELRRQVEDLLRKGHIRESLSPCAVPALLIPKKDGTWRMCADSRAINKITVRYRFPIPRLDDLLD